MNSEIMFSKKSDQWSTPSRLYDQYLLMGAYDPCPIEPSFNGLEVDWQPFTYVNPPYSEIRKWLEKALLEIERGHCHLAIFLVPARVDTKWFHELVYGKHAYKLLDKRLKFGDSKQPAPFPSMIIYLT